MSDKKPRLKIKKTKKVKQKVSPEVELLKTQLARTLADYDNLTKRVEREREQFGQIAKSRFVVSLLPVLDMLAEAQSHLEDAGLAMTIQSFEQVLSDEGFVKIEPEIGEVFDEEYHEAIELLVSDESAEGEIVEIVLVGWKTKDDVLIRAAKVKVVGSN